MNIRMNLLAASAAAILVAGCGGAKAPAAADNGASGGTNKVVAQGGGATVTQDANGSTTVTTNQGSAQVTSGTPSGNMPGGLPPYPNAQAGGADISGSAEGAQGRVVSFTTTDQPAQVLDFYANAAGQAGLQTMARTQAGPNGALALMKGSEAVTVSTTQMGGTTQVQIASGSR